MSRPEATEVERGGVELLASRADHSWLQDLRPDPETAANEPNKTSRQVRSGHYVKVKPTPLRQPSLVTFSPAMAKELGLSEEACRSEAFVRFFSGDPDVAEAKGLESWATPYALSICGEEYLNNCPFKNGNGYGDGRAISVGEVVIGGKRWEMQLKGSGQTPFCRGADGRAVLRSSIREFLASEAMYAMGVETTRALSLVVSKQDTARRGWFSSAPRPKVDEELLNQATRGQASAMPDALKQQLMAALRQQVQDMDEVNNEPCAITCRVAPSFLRVGHIDLHGRRARAQNTSGTHMEHLELMVKHALKREYADGDDSSLPLQRRIIRMARECAHRLSKLVADWLRVGYCQGNFNSDNCLIAGRTMDYGPFGFIEKYDPMWNMWTGGNENYAFMNQPQGAYLNFRTFTRSLTPLLDKEGVKEIEAILDHFPSVCEEACDDMWRRKLGFQRADSETKEIFNCLEKLMVASSVDWTVFWRQLAEFPGRGLTAEAKDCELLAVIESALYEGLSSRSKDQWCKWIRGWLQKLKADGSSEKEQAALMRATSPKYLPREWMLVEAYQAAHNGNYSILQDLYRLFSQPFDEQPEFEERYYRKAPPAAQERPGTAFMS